MPLPRLRGRWVACCAIWVCCLPSLQLPTSACTAACDQTLTGLGRAASSLCPMSATHHKRPADCAANQVSTAGASIERKQKLTEAPYEVLLSLLGFLNEGLQDSKLQSQTQITLVRAHVRLYAQVYRLARTARNVCHNHWWQEAIYPQAERVPDTICEDVYAALSIHLPIVGLSTEADYVVETVMAILIGGENLTGHTFCFYTCRLSRVMAKELLRVQKQQTSLTLASIRTLGPICECEHTIRQIKLLMDQDTRGPSALPVLHRDLARSALV